MNIFNAIYKNDIEKVKEFIDNKGDMKAKNKDGYPALIYAAIFGRIEIAKLLIEKKADVNANDKDGDTALIYAAIFGHTKLVKWLIDNGALVNAENKDGNTALSLAAYNGHTEIVKILKEKSEIMKYKPISYYKQKLSEHIIQSQIVQHLNFNGIRYFAVPNGIFFNSENKEKSYAYIKKLRAEGFWEGVADLCLLLPNARLIFVEVKTRKGRQNSKQKEFESLVKELGFKYYIWRDVDDAINFLKNMEK